MYFWFLKYLLTYAVATTFENYNYVSTLFNKYLYWTAFIQII